MILFKKNPFMCQNVEKNPSIIFLLKDLIASFPYNLIAFIKNQLGSFSYLLQQSKVDCIIYGATNLKEENTNKKAMQHREVEI